MMTLQDLYKMCADNIQLLGSIQFDKQLEKICQTIVSDLETYYLFTQKLPDLDFIDCFDIPGGRTMTIHFGAQPTPTVAFFLKKYSLDVYTKKDLHILNDKDLQHSTSWKFDKYEIISTAKDFTTDTEQVIEDLRLAWEYTHEKIQQIFHSVLNAQKEELVKRGGKYQQIRQDWRGLVDFEDIITLPPTPDLDPVESQSLPPILLSDSPERITHNFYAVKVNHTEYVAIIVSRSPISLSELGGEIETALKSLGITNGKILLDYTCCVFPRKFKNSPGRALFETPLENGSINWPLIGYADPKDKKLLDIVRKYRSTDD